MNPTGLVAGAAAFLGIWLGHVAVRRIEASTPVIWFPALAFGSAGLILEYVALSVASPLSSAAAGISGITVFWDAIELFRQERRVQRGHARANPSNPRHRSMLAAPDSAATTADLRRREPL